MSWGGMNESRPRRERHVVSGQERIFGRAGLRRVEVPRQRVAVTEPGECRPGDSAQDPGRRAEYLLEVGTETESQETTWRIRNLCGTFRWFIYERLDWLIFRLCLLKQIKWKRVNVIGQKRILIHLTGACFIQLCALRALRLRFLNKTERIRWTGREREQQQLCREGIKMEWKREWVEDMNRDWVMRDLKSISC